MADPGRPHGRRINRCRWPRGVGTEPFRTSSAARPKGLNACRRYAGQGVSELGRAIDVILGVDDRTVVDQCAFTAAIGSAEQLRSAAQDHGSHRALDVVAKVDAAFFEALKRIESMLSRYWTGRRGRRLLPARVSMQFYHQLACGGAGRSGIVVAIPRKTPARIRQGPAASDQVGRPT